MSTDKSPDFDPETGFMIYTGAKAKIPEIKTMAMLKMEKNFIAVNSKGYPQRPYEKNCCSFLIDRVSQETEELKDAYLREDLVNMLEELADVSNLLDYIFEQVSRALAKKRDAELLRAVDQQLSKDKKRRGGQ